MVDIIQIATVVGVMITVVGGFFTMKEQYKRAQLNNKNEIIASFKKEIEPIQVSLEKDNKAIYTDLNLKENSINDLWKDIERLEDHLHKLEVDVSKHSGVIDLQTPLIMEVKNQILSLKEKIDLLTKTNG